MSPKIRYFKLVQGKFVILLIRLDHFQYIVLHFSLLGLGAIALPTLTTKREKLMFQHMQRSSMDTDAFDLEELSEKVI